mmetsp:Transcript_38664/g.98886  ORF Transcript_38664/g.98886 Transcript_38664/m.98886 type:complete len:370 (+) Transcript_38664:130-1239(+)|eukprot:jgi/Tetstr1/460710/TSEL_005897.t1
MAVAVSAPTARLQRRGSTFLGAGMRATRATSARSTQGRCVDVRAARVLIANTKGGGHSAIGPYLAKELLQAGHTITILNDGDPAKQLSKLPFVKYPALESQGVRVAWGNPADLSSFPPGEYDIVVDNNGKDVDTCRALIDTYGSRVQQYFYVSSAGMHKDNPLAPIIKEHYPRKEKAHFFVEEYLKEKRVPATIFRPLYPYGEFSPKDCEQWFMDRILRDRPVPVPFAGTNLVSLSHVEDLACMMAAAVGNPNAIGQAFNLTSDTPLTHAGIAQCIGKLAGKEVKIVCYNPDTIELSKGEGFPFRTGHFAASADKAKVLLGWAPKHAFEEDMKARLAEYMSSGRMQKDVDFSGDDKILAALGYYAPARY